MLFTLFGGLNMRLSFNAKNTVFNVIDEGLTFLLHIIQALHSFQ